MIVVGLAAGSVATLVCLLWTCMLYDCCRLKGDDTGPGLILPVTTATPDEANTTTRTISNSSNNNNTTIKYKPSSKARKASLERNAALLKALNAIDGTAVPLPPPTSIVPAVADGDEKRAGMTAHYSRKRKYDEVTAVTSSLDITERGARGAVSWKDPLSTIDDDPKDDGDVDAPISTRSPTSGTRGHYKIRQCGDKTSTGTLSAEKNIVDPFSFYDKQYQTAFVQREVYDAAVATSRWKICARTTQASGGGGGGGETSIDGGSVTSSSYSNKQRSPGDQA